MSIVASQLIAMVKVEGADEAKLKLEGVGRASEGAGGMLKGALLGAAVAAGTALVGIGVGSVKMAGDFQQAVLSLVAHAGLAKDQIGNVSQAILSMATEVGRSPTQLAEAMYPILSAFSGITDQSAKSKLALDTLSLSFKAVAGTTVNGTAVAQAAVGTFNALGLATNNAGTNATRMKGLFDQMDLTVQLGNMTWDQYKMVIAKVATAIQGTGVNFQEASAALATLTNSGMSARQAGTYLANLFTDIGIKTDAMAKHAAKAGVAFNEQAFSSMDLAHKIEYLNRVTDDNKQKLLAVLGNNATALKAFDALSTGVNAYKSNLESLNHAQGALATSFATASEGFNFQMSRMKAAGESLMVTLGTALLPTVTKLVTAITPLITQFVDWETKTHGIEKALSTVGGIINNVIGFFKTWGPTISQTKDTIASLWPILQQIGDFLKNTFMPVWQQLVDTWKTQVKPAWDQFIAALGPAMPALKFIGEVIGVVIVGALMIFVTTLAVVYTTVIFAVGLIVRAISMLVVSFLNTLTLVSNVVNGIIYWFNRLPVVIPQIINYVIAWITHQWDMLVLNVTTWGSNFINNFLTGLQTSWKNVVTWVNGALAWIAGLFPHSPVEHGPLMGIENWGKNMTDALATSIRAGMPGVQSAFGGLTLPGVSGGATSFAGGSSSLLPGLSPSIASAGSQTIIINPPAFYIDGREMTQALGPHLAKQLRVQTGHRGVV